MRPSPLPRLIALAIAFAVAIALGAGAGATPRTTGTGTGCGTGIVDGGLVVTPTPLDFGTISIGTTAGSSLSLQNTNSMLAVTIKAPLGIPATPDCAAFSVTPAPALPDTIPAMTTRTWAVSFKPSAASSYDCQWTLDDDDGNPDVIHLTGVGASGHITVFPSPVDFGAQPLNTTVDQTVTISNDGSGSIAVTGITQTAGNPPFTILGLPGLPVTLPPSASTSFTARFHPTSPMTFLGTVRVDDSGPSSTGTIVQLTGTGGGTGSGSAVITLAPSPVDFGAVAVGATGTASLNVGDSGASTLNVSGMSIAGSNATDFHFADGSLGCTSGQSCGAAYAVAPASTPRAVGLACSPSVAGLRFATLSVTSDATSGTNTVTLQCNGAAANITVSPGSIAYGTIKVGTTAHANLTIGNSGASDLNVTGLMVNGVNASDFAATTCASGCLVPAGKSTVVDVTFTPPARGLRTATLHVLSDDPTRPDVAVGLGGTGGLPVMVITQPSGKSVDFGGIPVGSTSATAPITVQNQGELTLTIMTAGTSAPFGAAGPTAPIALAPSTSATWNVTCHPTLPMPYSGSFSLAGDDPAKPTDMVTLACTGITTNLTAMPSPLSFGEVRIGATLKKTLTITNTGALPVTVGSAPISSAMPFTEAVTGGLPRTLNQNDTLSIDVTYTPTAEGHDLATLDVRDGSNASLLPVALSGDARTAAYDVAPGTIDFGSRCVAQADNQDVVITNRGTAHISLVSTAISGGNGAFTIASGNVSAPIDLAPTASHTVSIVGTAAQGARTGSLVVTTDVAAEPTTSVALSITGTSSGVVANPSSVAFGAHDLGVASSPTAVSLINCSASPLTVSAANVTGADAAAFQVSGTQPITIPVGGDQPWNVVFTAQHAGTHTATLELHDDGATDPIAVTLGGDGNGTGAPDGGLDGSNGEDTTSYYACACRSGATPGGGLPILFALVFVVRRRRR